VRIANKSIWASALALVCAATAVAQDVPGLENPYDLKRKNKGQNAPPRAPVDPALVQALGLKVEQCYAAEQKAPLPEEERALLSEFANTLAYDLEAGLTNTSCQLNKPASAVCLKEVAALDCEHLAQPIIDAGWDRNLPKAAKLQVAEYADGLARRKAGCRGYAADEADFVIQVDRDRLAALVEMQVVTGQCQLFLERLPECKTKLATVRCGEVNQADHRGELSQLCDKFLECSIKGVDTDAAQH
jgi:hypothetical protein